MAHRPLIHSSPILCFDIETVPDTEGLQRCDWVASTLSEADASRQARQLRLEQSGSEFLPLPFHRVVAIACVFRDREDIKLHVFADDGTAPSQERDIIQKFFRIFEKHQPQLVSWNGGGFDLPVLHYRAMRHRISASAYWDMGEHEREFKFNNYINRYHMRHLDLMDLLALYQPRSNAALETMAKLCGLPGKLGMSGEQVADAWLDGKAQAIADYCCVDALNTYLLYCNFLVMRGELWVEDHQAEYTFVREKITQLTQQRPFWQEYLSAWEHH